MLKTLMKIKLQGLLYGQVKSSKGKTASKGKIILMALLFGYVGVVFCGMFAALFYSLVEPLHAMQLEWLYFALMSLIVIIFCFIGSVFITEHEMYEAKDNELLMSMPIKNQDILLSRICIILFLNYVYELLIMGPALVIYILNRGMNIGQILCFLIVFLTLPLFVLAVTCAIAWVVAHIMHRIRKKNMLILIVWIAFFGLYMYGITYIEQYIGLLIQNGKTIAQAIETSLFPIYHLSIAIENTDFISLLIYLIFAIIPFIVVVSLLSKNFIKMATTKAKSKKIEYKEKPMKQQSVIMTLLMRELRHFTSNAMVMLNGAMGIVLTVIATIALILYAPDLKAMLNMIPGIEEWITPILCIMGIGVGSLNIITASSISLEGNRLWILKTLPVEEKDILNVKLLMHLIMCIPANLFYSIVASILFKVNLLDALMVILVPNLFTFFIALLGLLLNLWKPKFDWVNETVCVKQSMPVMITMFVSMGLVFVLGFLYVGLLSDMISITTYMYLMSVVIIVINIYFYYLIATWGIKRFKEL